LGCGLGFAVVSSAVATAGDDQHECNGKSGDHGKRFHASGLLPGVQLQDSGSSYSSDSSHGSWQTPHTTYSGSPQKYSLTPFSGQVSFVQVTVFIMRPRKLI
jgi:hypothetical protein